MKHQHLHFRSCKKIFTALLLFSFIVPTKLPAQLAAGKPKFLGNVIPASAPSSFATYWNQVTPENSGKWGSVEATRNSMNWGQLDIAYNYAKSHGYKFKEHTLVWGAQFPSWLTSLSQADQQAEVIQWMQALAQRYPAIDIIDVVNEPVKTPCPFKNALGGDGSTGWDWVIWSFQKARQFFPNAKLLINEYGTENDATARNQYITIINLLKSRGLIDGIGIQAHCFTLDNTSASQLTTCLNAYAATGLDIYITELDIRGVGATINESTQSQKYQELFPVMWNHASVKGMTLWGYIEGQTWKAGTGLLNSNGTERAAMTWLKSFMNGGGGSSGTVTVRARGTNGTEQIQLRVNNTVVTTWTLTTTLQNYTANVGGGTIRVQFINDATNRDVQVDYIIKGSTTFQSENQSVNTGVFQNGACGGSNSEWLHCNGYIEYAGSSARSATEPGITNEETIPVAGISVYPNPVTGRSVDLTLGDLKGITDLRVTDMNGKVVKQVQVNEQQKINLQLDLSPGIYIIHGTTGNKQFTRKISVL